MQRVLFHNAKVYVARGVYAQAVLTEGSRIVKVGTNEDVLAERRDGDDVRDCGGRTMIPGLNDSHMHLFMFSETLNQAKLDGVSSISEMIQICRDFAEQHPELVKHGMRAVGWNQDLFTDEKRIPTKEDLDKISTEYPIVLDRVCTHICVCNTKALEATGITEATPQPVGGEFELGADGKPNGVLKESATSFANLAVPPYTLEDYREMLGAAQAYAFEHGLTSVQSNDIGTSACQDQNAGFELLKDMVAKGELKIRYRSQTSFANAEQLQSFLTDGEFAHANYGEDPLLSVGAVKMFRDGSLGGRTALLREGYMPDQKNHGLEWHSMEEIRSYLALAKQYGIPVVIHVIGDGAVESVLEAFEEVQENGKNENRNAMIHCQITDKALLNRIQKDDILVYAQPIFIDYDRTIVEPLCGKELASTSYAFGTLLKNGVHLSYGTDCPVESCNPFPNLYTAITRKGLDGQPEGGFHAEECVDRETAIDAYTYESAYAEFLEDRKGRIQEGYYADLVLLDTDIFTCEEEKIPGILSDLTMVRGEIVYER